jgi:hypothetical protein
MIGKRKRENNIENKVAKINADSISITFSPSRLERKEKIMAKINPAMIETRTPGQPEINIKTNNNSGPYSLKLPL